MGDFNKFIQYLENGDTSGVASSYRPEFLERPDNLQRRPIHLACINGHVDIAKFLVEKKCDIECKDDKGWRPIHMACWKAHGDIAKLLIEKKCDIECKDYYGQKPIHLACIHGHVYIAKFLIEKKCDIECKDDDGQKPIHYSCTYGRVDIAKLLIEKKCDIECTDDKGQKPIHLACMHGHVYIAKLLIEKECDIDCKDNWGQKPIHLACIHGLVDIAKLLIERKCDIECKDDKGQKPIHLAFRFGLVDIAKLLIEKKCDIECKDNWGWRPIHRACWNEHGDIAKLLIEKKCDIECEDDKGWRPIHYACVKGHIEIVKLLVRNKVELLCKTNDEKTPLDLVKKNKDWECEELLTEALKSNQTGLSFLEVVLKENAAEVLKYLLDKNVENEEIPPIKVYIENCSRPAAVGMIQEFFLYRSIRDHHADGFELSCLANIINGHRNIATSSFVETAAEHGASAFITEILKKSIYNKEEWTRAKDLANRNGYKKIVDAILDREILLTSREKAHFSLFHNAICDNDPDMMRYLFNNCQVHPNFNNEVVGTGLSLAYMLCHAKCIETLQQFKVDVNTQNKYSQSPLHEAISSGMTDHCSYLISRARDIDKPGFMGLTGLQCAVMKGLENLCDELLKNGADCLRYVEDLQKSHFRESVLPISTRENAVTLCVKMHGSIYTCLLKAFDLNKVNCSDGNGNTLLHMAVQALRPRLCKTLINCGENIGATNMQGYSPLFVLFSQFDRKIIDENIEKIRAISDILIDSGADINTRTRLGVTVFKIASQCNSERLMFCLLRKNPNIKLVTGRDFKLAFTNAWFGYAKSLIDRIPEDSLKSFITTDIFPLAMTRADPEILTSMFMKASGGVQQSIIEDLLRHFSDHGEYGAFLNLMETKIIEQKRFSNGETLLTNLLLKKNEKYCRAVIGNSAYKKYLNMANLSCQIPLQVAIESDLYDLLCPLIDECDQLNNEDNEGNTPLVQLFKKLSTSTDTNTDDKLMTAVKASIARGADIYKETTAGIKVIEFCSRLSLRAEIKDFEKNNTNKGCQITEEHGAKEMKENLNNREFCF